MITTYLIISHLVSDFLLQPVRLIKWKMRSYKGTVFHVFIFELISLLFLFPYLARWETWVIVAIIGIVHFFTDQAKINIELKNDTSDVPFIADQGIHYLSLVLGGHFLDSLKMESCYKWLETCLYQDVSLWMIIMGIIYLIYCTKIALMHKTRKTILQKILVFTLVYLVYFGTVIVVFK